MGNSAHAADTKDALASAAITAGEAAIAAMRLCPWTCLACRAGLILEPRGGDAGHGHQVRIFPLAEAAKDLAFLKAKGQSRRIALAI
jgi:hypothetical protein